MRDPHPDREIASLAACHDGVVEHSELIAIGLTEKQIQYRIRVGRLHVIHKRVYAVGHPNLTAIGRRRAALAASGRDAVLSHRSAAAIWGLPIAEGRRVHISVPRSGRRNRPGLVVHATSLHPDDRTMQDGLPLTTAVRTILDLAPSTGPAQLDRLAAKAAFRGLLGEEILKSCLARASGRRGVCAFREAVDGYRLSELTRSPPEALYLKLCRRAGLPEPAVNVPVCGYEVDFFWRDAGLVVEIDARSTHGDARSFENDPVRDATLRLAGVEVQRFTRLRIEEQPEWVVNVTRRMLNRSRIES